MNSAELDVNLPPSTISIEESSLDITCATEMDLTAVLFHPSASSLLALESASDCTYTITPTIMALSIDILNEECHETLLISNIDKLECNIQPHLVESSDTSRLSTDDDTWKTIPSTPNSPKQRKSPTNDDDEGNVNRHYNTRWNSTIKDPEFNQPSSQLENILNSPLALLKFFNLISEFKEGDEDNKLFDSKTEDSPFRDSPEDDNELLSHDDENINQKLFFNIEDVNKAIDAPHTDPELPLGEEDIDANEWFMNDLDRASAINNIKLEGDLNEVIEEAIVSDAAYNPNVVFNFSMDLASPQVEHLTYHPAVFDSVERNSVNGTRLLDDNEIDLPAFGRVSIPIDILSVKSLSSCRNCLIIQVCTGQGGNSQGVGVGQSIRQSSTVEQSQSSRIQPS
jgi:hypothetical protein